MRIEYHPSPGARFGASESGKTLDAVIDIITRRRDSGGTLMGDLMNNVEEGRHSVIDHLGWQHSVGKSALSVGAGYFEIDRSNWIRDYRETRITPAGERYREEKGEAVPILLRALNTHIGYSRAESGKYLFSAKLNYDLEDTPRSEEADRRCTVLSDETSSLIAGHMSERTHSPSLDLYFQHHLSASQTLTFDVLGTYIRSKSHREYAEDADVFFSDIRGNKYSVIAEGIFEQRIGTHTLSGGLRHLQAYTENDYTGSRAAKVGLRQSESSAYAEYQRSQEKWSYTASLTASRLYHSQGDTHLSRYALQPAASVQWMPTKGMSLRYDAVLHTKSPSLAAMNNVEQEIASGEVRRGNPHLKPFSVLDQRLTYGVEVGSWLSLNVGLAWQHEYKPIMEQVSWQEGLFVRMSRNQRSFDRLTADANIIIRPWGEHLTVTLTPEVNRYVSRMQGCIHTYTLPKFLWSADFVWHHWTLGYQEMTCYANYMYGERLMRERNMHLLSAGYKAERWHLQLGVIDPFEKEYWMETRDFSPLLPSTSRAYTEKPFYVMARLSFRLGYGRRQPASGSRKINNEDKDNGIMQGVR
ncbi:MAG: TonB-dependent receptor [Bacteroidaceae bacterium]|nr:TonB-dependent receptor [Bacteroidaceae bacterium]